MRKVTVAAISILAASAVGVSKCCVDLFVRPRLDIQVRSSEVIADMQWLGEYETTISRMRLSESVGNRTIWEVRSDEAVLQLFTLTLKRGKNPSALKTRRGAYRVLTPEASESFELVDGIPYTIEVWGDSPRWFENSASFSFGGS